MEQLKLNMIPNGVNPVFHASQYDKGRQIRFVLDESLSGAEVTVSYRAKDGTEYGNVQMSVSGSTITDTIPEEVLTDYGIIEGEVDIDGIGSLNFFVEVEKDAYDGGVITTQTASGAIATFETNIKTAFVSLKSDINPVQDLHGYSKPWSGGGGKNKLNITATTQTINGITFTIDSEGVVKTSGTFSENTNLAVTTNFFLKAGTYILNGCPSGGSYSKYVVRIENGSAQRLALDTGNGEQFTLAEDTYVWCRIYLYSQDGIGKTFKPMVRLATESDSSFAPYSNICPISGFSALNVTRTGVNLWDEVAEVGAINGTTGENQTGSTSLRSKNYIKVSPSNNVYLKMPSAGAWIYRYDKNKSYLGRLNYNANSVVTIPNDCEYIRFELYSQYGTTYNNDISINYPSSDTEYHAYNGQTATVNFGQTVYGGVADVTNGKLTITHIKITDFAQYYRDFFSGTYSTEYRITLPYPSTNVVYTVKRGSLCNCKNEESAYWGGNHTAEANSANDIFAINPLGEILAIYDSDTTLTKETFEAKYSGNIEFVYELATPIEITTTPETLTAIVGQNNVYSDTNGDTEVEYYTSI